MMNVFQAPWLLLIVSFVVLIAVYIFRQSFPDKRKWWQLFIPIVCIGIALGADYFVKTDHEKITSLMNTAANSVAQKDIKAIEGVFADDYSDRFHRSKEAILATCKRVMQRRSYEDIKITNLVIAHNGNNADIDVLARVMLDEQIAEIGAPFMYVKLKMTLTKRVDKSWGISKTNHVEINNNPVSW